MQIWDQEGQAYILIIADLCWICPGTVLTEGNVPRQQISESKRAAFQGNQSTKVKVIVTFCFSLKNKFLLNIPACKVNDRWCCVNNLSHISDAFNCSLFNNWGENWWFLGYLRATAFLQSYMSVTSTNCLHIQYIHIKLNFKTLIFLYCD